MSKELFIVPTPIGNLEDITLRALKILKYADVILTEDTRTAGRLLKHYEIEKKPFLAYHSANEKNFDFKKIFDNYSKAALISENGTPLISDPGYNLVNWCWENDIRITPLPGANAAFTLLSACGFPVKNTLFYGFLPNKKGKRKNILTDLLNHEKKTMIFYESPYRIVHFLEIVSEIAPKLDAVVGRELTKKFEEIHKKKTKEIYNYYVNKDKILGEFTVILNNGI